LKSETEKFSDILLMLIKEKRISQKELSSSAAIAESDLTRFLTGEREPRYSQLNSIADVLQVNPSIFFPENYALLRAQGHCIDCPALKYERTIFPGPNSTIQFLYEEKLLQTFIFILYIHADIPEATWPVKLLNSYNSCSKIFKAVKKSFTVNYAGGSIVISEGGAYSAVGYEQSYGLAVGAILKIILLGSGVTAFKDDLIRFCERINPYLPNIQQALFVSNY